MSDSDRRLEDEKYVHYDQALKEQYEGQVVAVHGRKVWGHGHDLKTALAVARSQPGCPPVKEMVLALVYNDKPFSIPFRRYPPELRKRPKLGPDGEILWPDNPS